MSSVPDFGRKPRLLFGIHSSCQRKTAGSRADAHPLYTTLMTLIGRRSSGPEDLGMRDTVVQLRAPGHSPLRSTSVSTVARSSIKAGCSTFNSAGRQPSTPAALPVRCLAMAFRSMPPDKDSSSIITGVGRWAPKRSWNGSHSGSDVPPSSYLRLIPFQACLTRLSISARLPVRVPSGRCKVFDVHLGPGEGGSKSQEGKQSCYSASWCRKRLPCLDVDVDCQALITAEAYFIISVRAGPRPSRTETEQDRDAKKSENHQERIEAGDVIVVGRIRW